uniref:TSA: Wollemia nobilis Ref_Wollemi_Transcript_15008_1978 transcribed RNA sequence n=1 Tax=Wollemia nobilis TaxID=56998 RepID=A0A0C9QPB8_9CONI
MKFGKRLQIQIEETLPEWRDKFLSYKPLKKRLKQLSAPECFTAVGFCAASPPHDGSSTSVVEAALEELRKGGSVFVDGIDGQTNEGADEEATLKPAQEVCAETNDEVSSQCSVHEERNMEKKKGILEEEDFIQLINEELEKFNNFFLEKEEEYVIYLQELKERIERLKEKSRQNGTYSSENEFNEETVAIRRDIVAIHGQMVLLENYSALNFTGLVKILKKYDKRTGALLRLPFIQSVLQQPFFTTELLSKLVRECEANLQSIFPAIPLDEVGACTTVTGDGGNSQSSLSLQGDTVESIYRSTLAALRTIKDLRKGSSTYNPLSFSSFIPGDVEDDFAAVANGKSMSNSSHSKRNSMAQNKENVPSCDKVNTAQP